MLHWFILSKGNICVFAFLTNARCQCWITDLYAELTNLFLQNCFLPFDLGEALDECFSLLAFCLKTVDLKSQLPQLFFTYLQCL